MAGGTGSTYPSTQWTTVKRNLIPAIAASDIVQGAPVRWASDLDWGVQMCASSNEKPIGIARDYAIAGAPVSVYDDGNIVREYVGGNGAGGSFSRQSYVGVVGTSTMTHPQSGVTVTYGVIGQVTGTPSVAVGASTASVWALGQALESAAIGDWAAYRVEPRLLSGLVLS